MKVEVQDVSDLRKKVKVTVPADRVASEEQELVKEFALKAKIPGFRPGKAPQDIVKRRYAKDLEEELRRKLLSVAYRRLGEDKELKVYSIVNMDENGVSENEPAEITLTLDVQPSFELPTYTGLKVEVPKFETTDKEVDRAIEHIREQRGDYKPVEREAKKGDYVKCSYNGTVDGKPVEEVAPEARMYGSQKNTWEEADQVEKGLGIAGIAKGVVGMKAGDKKTVEHVFEKDFKEAELAGKKATYELEVHEVREKILPEMNEAFFKEMRVTNLDELREQVRKEFQSRHDYESGMAKREQITKALADSIDFAIPQSAMDHEVESVLKERMHQELNQGVSYDDLEKRKTELFEEAQGIAKTRAKLHFILARIAEKESIKVENQDIQQRIMQEAMMRRQSPDELVKEIQKDRSHLEAMRERILFSKTLDFLLDQAKVSEVDKKAS